ncbi:hypothetical protein AVEN_106681-1 [Araneus ventricosus]|uniref:Uncharacterized protein n=1 Tax=Araneus ventricosus TaxID=182803 RepID=A0A4Y2WMK8_ARAVE|nr:hypothetical protein AVEN_106681-1 [Araneus ventricosus]
MSASLNNYSGIFQNTTAGKEVILMLSTLMVTHLSVHPLMSHYLSGHPLGERLTPYGHPRVDHPSWISHP